METKTYNSLSNIILFVSISSSVISLSYETNMLVPQINYNYHHNIADWKDNVFNNLTNYKFYNEDNQKIQTILEFSKKIIENLKDIDSEFVEIVNDNFWEII